MEFRLKDLGYTDRFIRGILERVRTVAIVGASLRDVRPSYFVVRYLVSKGYEVYPINPSSAGEVARAALRNRGGECSPWQ